MSASRLSLLQAAYVIARRDFLAILFSRAFFFFLLGPLFPVGVGALAGMIGQQVQSEVDNPQIGIAMAPADIQSMLAAREQLARELGPAVPDMVELEAVPAGATFDASQALLGSDGNLAAVVTGTLAAPVLTATPERLRFWRGPVALIAANAQIEQQPSYPEVGLVEVVSSGASENMGRLRTAQAGQVLLFLLIMLLAGMVLSNLVEEKGNKIIEILAAAIPMDAVFLGKLFAMLAISVVGVCVWSSVIGGLVWLSGMEAISTGPIDFSGMPRPAIGWPLFLGLGMLYFALGYLLLGSIFLAIGSLATTVREVQTLSMPVTMAQVLLFFFASYSVTRQGAPIELAATIFPLSSPFAMLARAAMEETLWPHLLAVGWQLLWVAIFVKTGATLFRKRVMKSGPSKPRRRGRRLPSGGA